MWWRLLAVVVLVVSAAQEEHFLDVKQIVKGTIEAVAKLPIPQQNTSHEEGEKNPDDFYRLFQLPADIMTKLAADAGYIDSPSTTTNGPWIVRRKVHKSSEDEQSFTQDGSEEEPRRRRKSKKNKDPTLISISDILSRVEQSSSSTPSPPAPMPAAPSPQASATNSAASLPVVQSSTDLSQSHVQPQYIYQPIVQPDGKTYYQQVLLVPGKVLSSGAVSSLRNPSIEKSSFLQERALQPKSVVQADYSITAPTFPPPIDIFRRQSQPLARAAVLAEPAQRSTLYPARFIKPAGQTLPQQEPLSRRIQITPQSDPAAISAPRPHQPMDDDTRYDATTPRESLYTTVLPSGEEQRSSARVFHEEAFAPPKQVMRTMQASPLRIKTIDSRVEPASSAETNAIRLLRREDELKKAMERHRLEVEQPRRRKLRKSRKSKKPSKKNKFVDEDAETPTVQATSEEFRSAIRRMPETQYMQRVPILTPSAARRHERVHASKTWKRRRMEPADEEVSKSLESFEKKADDEMVTEPPKKRKRTRKTGKSKRTKSITEEMRNERSRERSDEELQQQRQQQEQIQQRQHDDEIETTAVPLKRKFLRLHRFNADLQEKSSKWSDDEQPKSSETRRFRSHSRRFKKTRRSRRTKSTTTAQPRTTRSLTAESFPLRQHCLNIRTFARQFGSNDIEEFTQEHCAFIENYYPDLTCEKRTEYVAECQKYL